jgi:hypothetical protein
MEIDLITDEKKNRIAAMQQQTRSEEFENKKITG